LIVILIYHRIKFLDMASMITYPLKGCNTAFINVQVTAVIRDINIDETIENKVQTIMHTYTVLDCINIITQFGDIHDAFMKFSKVRAMNVTELTDKLIFHQLLAYSYIKNIIEAKIKHKVGKMRAKRFIMFDQVTDRTCAICLEDDIQDRHLFMTRCRHTFHSDCISKWHNPTCPNCRANM
jgi:hypothetical protein